MTGRLAGALDEVREITGAKDVDYEQIARQAVRTIGYDWADEVFNADGVPRDWVRTVEAAKLLPRPAPFAL